MASKCPRNLKVASVDCIRFSHHRFAQFLSAALGFPVKDVGKDEALDWSSFKDPAEAASAYLANDLFTKFDDGKPSPAKVENTWKRFHEAERLCFETNQRLIHASLDGIYGPAIQLARKLMDRILGRFDWDAAAEGFGWGPGASTRLPRRRSDAAYKFSGNPETTVGCAILADAAIRRIPLWKQGLENHPGDIGFCREVVGNRITTVPKNYKTDRTIAIEPDMNMYIQRGIGALMRRRLKLAGVDLNDQSRNQRLAMIGSFAGTLATIDLSMASDCVSRVLVERLVRPDWLQAIEQARSQFGVLPSGEKIFYQKVSSMGNGFTFELESCIFYSLALAWCHLHGAEVSRVSVYGDDIIIPTEVADSFIGFLRFCGFKPNEEKSFWTGPFRESCGKHFFRGHEITPFYVRKRVTTLPSLFLVHNNLYRWLERAKEYVSSYQYLMVLELLKRIRSLAPARWRRPRLMDGFGDGAFISNCLDELILKPNPDGWECWNVNVLSDVPSLDEDLDIPGLLVKSLSNLKGFTLVPALADLPEPVSVFPVSGAKVREITITIPQQPLAN